MGCCSGYNFAPAPDAALDLNQRVNFTFGMVLGVDDFRQEHAYLAARDERALRETIGYGAISGLDVTVHVDGTQVEVRVAPGLALLPDGKLVAVTVDQCARLDEWLTGPDKPAVDRSGEAHVYVVLRHLEVSDTPVPIPGEPCRDESALQADSRITDSFTLDFNWDPPAQTEDNGLRTFAAWLRLIEVRDAPVDVVDIPNFQHAVEEGVKAAIDKDWPRAPLNPPLAATPEVDPNPGWGSPPADLVIPRARYAEYINAAFDVWVRKLRAIYAAKHGPAPPAEATAETGLLLAAIDFKLSEGGLVYPSPPGPLATARWLGRPQLLHLRMLQEWLLTNVENDAPREAHYVLGKGDDRLPNAQDLASDFGDHNGALARVDLIGDSPPGGKAVLQPAVKWPGGAPGAGGPDYYGPDMEKPIPVSDGGTGQNQPPEPGQLLVGSLAVEESPPAIGERPAASFRLGRLLGQEGSPPNGSNITVDVVSAAPDILLDTVATPTFEGLTLSTLSNTVLAANGNHQIVSATRWDGGNTDIYYYAPHQTKPVRIEDGGTGLQQRPNKLQVLVGGKDGGNGRFVLAELVGGDGIKVELIDSSSSPPSQEIKFTASAGGITLPLAVSQGGTGQQIKTPFTAGQILVGNGTSFGLGSIRATSTSTSITVTADATGVSIDTAQAIHTGATPQFLGATLTNLQPLANSRPVVINNDNHLGRLERGALAWGVRVIRTQGEAVLQDDDQVLVFAGTAEELITFTLPSTSISALKLQTGPNGSRAVDSRVLVIKSLSGAGVNVTGPLEAAREGVPLKPGQSLTVIAVAELQQWLIIARA